MKQFEVELALQHVAAEQAKWYEAHKNFTREVTKIMDRLIHEAVANRMSVGQIAGASGFTMHRIRRQMKQMGLDYRTSKTALAESAARALRKNAELLGVDPLDIDLTSPLAYLPMGSQLRTELQSDAVRGVKTCDHSWHMSEIVEWTCQLEPGHEGLHANDMWTGHPLRWTDEGEYVEVEL